MEIIAHRGACFDAPENSLEAFRIAIDQDADRLELDIQIARDGVPIVCHDATTGRTGSRDIEIEFADSDEIRGITLSNGEPFPTLDELCAVAAGRVALDVELKATNDAVARSVLDTLAAHDLLDDALITSFDAQVLRRLRLLGFEGRTGLLIGSKSLNMRQRAYETWPMATLVEARATDLVIHHMLAHRALRSALRRRGLGLVLWTAVEDEDVPQDKRERLYRRLERIGADGVIVGRVAEARSVLASE